MKSWQKQEDALEELARERGFSSVLTELEQIVEKHPGSTEAYLLAGRFLARLKEYETALQMFDQATSLAMPKSLAEGHPDTKELVGAQLSIGRQELARRTHIAVNLNHNLKALRKMDPHLVEEILLAKTPEHWVVIDLWGKRRYLNTQTGRTIGLSQRFAEDVRPFLSELKPIGFCGASACQEILFALEHTVEAFMGQTVPHFVFEEDPGNLRLLLQLADLSSEIRERRLIFFGGSRWREFLGQTFRSRRIPPPVALFGDKSPYLPECDQVQGWIQVEPGERERVRDYYRSETHARRLEDIARGKAKPRILVLTCRWRTVFPYLSRDFARNFEDLGCQTETIVEQSDVERLSEGVYLEALEKLKPEMVFAVSQARPSYPFLPRELPFVCIAMDNIGPILELKRLDPHIQPIDLFFHISRWFKDYQHNKGVPAAQLIDIATPGDHRTYHPLDARDPLRMKFAADVALMKHGGSDPDQAMEKFSRFCLSDPRDDPFLEKIRPVFWDLHEWIKEDRGRQRFEAELREKALSLLGETLDDNDEAALDVLLAKYNTGVFEALYRFHFLEPFVDSDLKLRLYGHSWEKHPLFLPYAGGVVTPGEELNAAYNGSKINLHIHQSASMHQRLVEGALAGAFFMINRLGPEKAHVPLAPHFEEGRDVILFDSADDLLEKCRYYLAHEDERRAIAGRMRERALAAYTMEQSARLILESYQIRLGSCL